MCFKMVFTLFRHSRDKRFLLDAFEMLHHDVLFETSLLFVQHMHAMHFASVFVLHLPAISKRLLIHFRPFHIQVYLHHENLTEFFDSSLLVKINNTNICIYLLTFVIHSLSAETNFLARIFSSPTNHYILLLGRYNIKIIKMHIICFIERL